jgi:plasmid maintenance system antidote protein VapI
MESIRDFEDILELLDKHKVRYLIIGGLAFIYHAKPRYTKDMDLWIDPAPENIKQANRALAEFGSPYTLTFENVNEILQLGVAPDRIDLIMNVSGATFETAWRKRIRGRYGEAKANWIDLDSLIRIKSRINNPRHQEDVRVLREVRKRRARSTKAKKK